MDTLDKTIRQSLKQWVSDQRPPSNGKARLLAEITHPKPKAEMISSTLVADIPHEIFSWMMVYSSENGVTALRLVS